MNSAAFASKNRLLSWLENACGISNVELQLIGAFIVTWSLFEYELEKSIWRLANINPSGIRPATDALPASARLIEFRRLCSLVQGSNEWHEMADAASDAIENLIAIRNIIAHGHVLPGSVGGG